MGDIIDLNEYRKMTNVDSDYEKFITAVNKAVGIPTSFNEIIRSFYFGLRYLDGTINCFEILSMVNSFPPEHVEQLKKLVSDWVEEIKDTLGKY
jgi:hypothetical protein